MSLSTKVLRVGTGSEELNRYPVSSIIYLVLDPVSWDTLKCSVYECFSYFVLFINGKNT